MIGTKELLRLVKEHKLVENLSERELNNPEGEGFDLRVGEVYKITGKEAFLGITERSTSDIESVGSYDELLEKQPIITLNPGDYVLVKTIEKVNLPHNISVIFTPRTTLQRNGVILITSNASPGYSGELTFGMRNAGNVVFRLELGARIATGLFHETSENHSSYRGQWQGGRISTQGKTEVQV